MYVPWIYLAFLANLSTVQTLCLKTHKAPISFLSDLSLALHKLLSRASELKHDLSIRTSVQLLIMSAEIL